ncbi:unnamed protein product [Lactuca virosa]|uniref:Uncharacterized protein n=1 Tax=Lactuca virosa TaxID=75947 RepID=A0AAU9P3B5_9ASTR|nr:unnamed protein product [Lactuca virosa]
MNFDRGRLFRNFLTNLDSSMVSPRAADFKVIPDNFPAYKSIDSDSDILSRSNSDIKFLVQLFPKPYESSIQPSFLLTKPSPHPPSLSDMLTWLVNR